MPRPCRRPLLIAPLVLLVPLAGCADGPFGPERDELRDNLRRWQSRAPASYRYVYEASCFCGPAPTEPVEVVVVDGEVRSVTSVATGEPARPALPGGDPDGLEALTIQGLFAFLLESLEGDPASFRATYDAGLGYPRSAFVDFRARVADEEFGFEARGLAPLAASDVAPEARAVRTPGGAP